MINNSSVEQVDRMKEKHLFFMQQNYPEHYHANYKTDKLKDKIQREFGDKVKFWQLYYHIEPIYSAHAE